MSLPNTRHLEAFMAVAEARSFRVAAARIGMSQPALSQNIAQLEAQLGRKLFLRSTRSVLLTAEGAELHRHLDTVLPALREAVDRTRHLGDGPQIRLRVGFLASAVVRYLPEALRRFRADFPRAEVSVCDDTADGLYTAVDRGALDLAVSSYLPPDHRQVAFTLLVHDPFRAVLRRDHPLARRDSVTWAELLRHDFIGANPGSGTRFAIEAAMASRAIPMRTVMDFNHFLAVAGMVDAGLGVSALPLMNCPTADHPTLCSVTLTDPVVTRDLGILTRQADGGIAHHIAQFRDTILTAADRG